MSSDRICPLFLVSSVTGSNIDKLSRFLYNLENRVKTNVLYKGIDQPVEYDIQEHMNVPGVGLVVSGVLKAGTVKTNLILQFGPDHNGKFK